MGTTQRWILGALLLLAPAACADRADDGMLDEDVADAIEEEGTLEAPPDESATGAALVVEERMGLGSYLSDQDGRAVYLFTADEGQAGSTCYLDCADMWPPMIAERGDPHAASGEVREELIGTVERTDGVLQVTYGDHPLYYYREDAGPGEITGQDRHTHGGEWYLVTPAGVALEQERE